MKTFTKEELKDILEKHKKWLNKEKDGVRADLRSADLRSANLRYADLSSADLRNADLRNADLRYADLSSADLRYADLRSANLRYADLRYADLSNADLSSADLRSADLITFQFRRHMAYFTFDDHIRIGCHNLTIKTWLKDFKKIGKAEDYSKDEIDFYGTFIKQCSKLKK